MSQPPHKPVSKPMTIRQIMHQMASMGFRDAEDEKMPEREKVIRGFDYLFSLLDDDCIELVGDIPNENAQRKEAMILAQWFCKLKKIHELESELRSGDIYRFTDIKIPLEEICWAARGKLSPPMRRSLIEHVNLGLRPDSIIPVDIQRRIAYALQEEEQTNISKRKMNCFDPSIVSYGKLPWRLVFAYYYDYHRNGGIDYLLKFDEEAGAMTYMNRLPSPESMENLKRSEEKFEAVATLQEKIALERFLHIFDRDNIKHALDCFDFMATKNAIACNANFGVFKKVELFFEEHANTKKIRTKYLLREVSIKINEMLERGWKIAVCLARDQEMASNSEAMSDEHVAREKLRRKCMLLLGQLEVVGNTLDIPKPWRFPWADDMTVAAYNARIVLEELRDEVIDATCEGYSNAIFYRQIADNLLTFGERLYAVCMFFVDYEKTRQQETVNELKKKLAVLHEDTRAMKILHMKNVIKDMDAYENKFASFENVSVSFGELTRGEGVEWFSEFEGKIQKPEFLPVPEVEDYDCSQPGCSEEIFFD